MTAVLAMVVLGAACWLVRVALIVLVPAERLPSRVSGSLQYLAPAVMAALVAVEVTELTRQDDPATTAYVVLTVLLVGVAVRRTSAMSVGIAIALASALVLDLVLLG